MTTGIEAMRRYLGKKEKFYLNDEKTDYIELEPIFGDKAPEFFAIMSKLSGMDEKDIAKSMDREAGEMITALIKYVLEKSMPEANETEINEFVNIYYLQLFEKIMEMNVPEDVSKQARRTGPKSKTQRT